MDASRFRTSTGLIKQGHLDRTEYTYFVPGLLPRSLRYTDELAYALSLADSALGQLSGLGRNLPNPNLLITPYLRREAVLSSKIEGTQASLSDVFLEESGAENASRAGDAAEVVAYVWALNQGIRRLAEGRRLDLDLLRELHGILLHDVRGKDKKPGRFREEQNWIGPKGLGVKMASYVPPAVPEMKEALADFDLYLGQRPRTPNLVQAALLHYQFEAIHPFLDGNGRIGRLMIILFLLERRSLSAPLLYLSAYFEQHRQSYYEHLMHVSESGECEEWLLFFLEGVATQSEDALARGQSLVSLRERYRRSLQAVHATPGTLALLDRLFENPFVSIPRAAGLLDVTFPTAQRAVEYLEEAGIVRETTGQQRHKRYRADEILRTLELDAAGKPAEPSP